MLFFVITVLCLSLCLDVHATPAQLDPRYLPSSADDSSVGASDANIISFALGLEQLEASFYQQGVQNFTAADFRATGVADEDFYENLQLIARDEVRHVQSLSSSLQSMGIATTPPCTYTFPVTDANSFLALANIIEGVGVSAYAGAISSIAGGDVLNAAAAILAVEGRHSAFLRKASRLRPFAAAFDTSLNFNQAYSLVAKFILHCPYPVPFDLNPFPELRLLNSEAGSSHAGHTITLETPGYVLAPVPAKPRRSRRQHDGLEAIFLSPTGPVFVEANQISPTTYTAVVPDGLSGQSYVLLSSCKDRLKDTTTAAGPAVIEIA